MKYTFSMILRDSDTEILDPDTYTDTLQGLINQGRKTMELNPKIKQIEIIDMNGNVAHRLTSELRGPVNHITG